jgi:hypothetical protein
MDAVLLEALEAKWTAESRPRGGATLVRGLVARSLRLQPRGLH